MKLSKKISGLALFTFATALLSGCFSPDVGPTAADIHKADSTASIGTENLDEVSTKCPMTSLSMATGISQN